jgi:hypothetical protein
LNDWNQGVSFYGVFGRRITLVMGPKAGENQNTWQPEIAEPVAEPLGPTFSASASS